MTVATLLKDIRTRLKAAADPEFEAGLRWFFKEPVTPYGIRTPQVREFARLAYAHVKQWPVAERDRFVTELWKSGMLEEGVLVCHLYRRFAKSCGEREFRMFEQWINRYVTNWSNCDGVSTWLIAASIANRPGLTDRLAGWTKSKNRWKRRSAAVSLIQEAKQGRNTEIIFHICELLLEDSDDMVQKGVGWLLKETYPKRPREVLEFLDGWRSRAPRLVLRLAAEKMTEGDRQRLLTRAVQTRALKA
jgi:3-methyladenine DNA glycosylase AlkD